MTTPHKIRSAVLARYFGGIATPEEQASVEAWIGSDPARRAAVAAWEAAWRADAEYLGAAYDAETAWTRLSARVGLPTLVRGERPTRAVRLTPLTRAVSRHVRIMRWAAAAAAIVAAGAGTWYAIRQPTAGRVATMPAVREYATRRGQRSVVRLPDGTEVLLNVASRLVVPATFGTAGQERRLTLEGQAYFTVIHDDRRPFTVRTVNGIVRDVGTRFDVRAYSDDHNTRVVVTDGEVAVRGDSALAEVPVYRGQAAQIEAGRVTVARQVDFDRLLAWTRGQLELDDVTLAEAARRIGRWYDLEVRIAGDKLMQRRVVGSYRDEPVAQVLDIIAAAVGARYEWQGKSVTFVPSNDH